jgi:hypothetical protein
MLAQALLRTGTAADSPALSLRADTAFASTMTLPHCGQCQPSWSRTMATRQIGQDRVLNVLFSVFFSRMLPRCRRHRTGTIQEWPYP